MLLISVFELLIRLENFGQIKSLPIHFEPFVRKRFSHHFLGYFQGVVRLVHLKNEVFFVDELVPWSS